MLRFHYLAPLPAQQLHLQHMRGHHSNHSHSAQPFRKRKDPFRLRRYLPLSRSPTVNLLRPVKHSRQLAPRFLHQKHYRRQIMRKLPRSLSCSRCARRRRAPSTIRLDSCCSNFASLRRSLPTYQRRLRRHSACDRGKHVSDIPCSFRAGHG
jgi:hypothetical protein